MSPTLSELDGRHVLRFERSLRHPREKVWRALTSPAELSHWFPADVETTWEPGSAIRFAYRGIEDMEWEPSEAEQTGEVVAFDEPARLVFRWADEVLSFSLAERGDGGTTLVFEHTFDDRPGAASFATGWTLCLDAFEVVLDGEVPEDPAGDLGGDLHERFMTELGLDEGSVSAHGDGWLVRFDRQFMRPIPEVWDELAEPSPEVGSAPPSGFVVRGIGEVGDVVDVEPPTGLEYVVSGGRVRFQLTQGPGGARLVLLQTGRAGTSPEGPLTAWREHLRSLGSALAPS